MSESKKDTFFAKYSFLILFLVLFCGPFIWIGWRRAIQSNRNEVKEWLPEHFEATREHSWFVNHFPHEQFVLISWEGCRLGDNEPAEPDKLRLFSEKLVPSDEVPQEQPEEPEGEGGEAKPKFFRKVISGRSLVVDQLLRQDPTLSEKLVVDLLWLRERLLQYHGELSKAQQLALERRVLQEVAGLMREEDRGQNKEERLEALGHIVDGDIGGSQVLSEKRRGEIAGRLDQLYEDLAGWLSGEDYRPTREEIEDQIGRLLAEREQTFKLLEGSLIGKDHEKTCLVVTLTEAAKGKNLRKTLEQIYAIAGQCGIRYHPTNHELNELHLGGPPVDNVAIDVEGERTLYRLAFFSAIVGLGISWLCFRSYRLIWTVFTCALLAAGVGLASVYWSKFLGVKYHTVDAVLLSMPSLVYVLAISGAVHIINYYHDAVRKNGLHGATERAIAHAWLPCTLAAVTTALGLGSLMASHIIPITKFGMFGAWGVLATLALLFLYVPMNLYYMPSREYVPGGPKNQSDEEHPSAIARFWRRVGGFIARRNAWVAAACTAVMVFAAIGLTKIHTSIKLMKFFSPDARIIHDYAWLEDQLGPLVPMEIVLKIDNKKCRLNTAERVRLVRNVELAVEQLPDVGGALSADTFAHGLEPDGGYVGDIVARRRILEDLPEYVEYDEEDGKELWRVSARVWALTDVDYGEFVNDLRNALEGPLPEGKDAAVPGGGKRKVPPVLTLYRSKGVEGIEAVYTGMVPLVYKAQRELMSGLQRSLAWAFGMIGLLMVAMFVLSTFRQHPIREMSPAYVPLTVAKGGVAGLLTMVPNLFPVLIIFGMMGWLGILVDIAMMMTASVALGVAVDDTIHYLTWFRRGLEQGRDRRSAIMLAYEKCGTAMTQTTLIGGLGLSVFAISTFTPTQRFGYLMLTLLAVALVGDLIYLPALLSGPLGRFFERAKDKGQREPQPPGDLASAASAPEATQPEEETVEADEVISMPLGGGNTPHSRPRRSAERRSFRAS